jgi:exocyst complex component 2
VQATLEIEFLHQTLGQYVTAHAKDILNDIYTSISQTFTRRNDSGNLQRELEDLKKILFEARRATSGHYLCFKPVKTVKAKKDGGKVSV